MRRFRADSKLEFRVETELEIAIFLRMGFDRSDLVVAVRPDNEHEVIVRHPDGSDDKSSTECGGRFRYNPPQKFWD